MTGRDIAKHNFLTRAGWADAQRHFLAGDASDRSYERLSAPNGTAVLMDAPPGKGDEPAAFLNIADHLRQLGLSAPATIAQDLAQGFLLLEDLGDGLFARLATENPAMEAPLYAAATDVLLHLHRYPVPPGLPRLTPADWAEAAAFAFDWYRFAATDELADTAAFRHALTRLIARHQGPTVLILRDYHAENLLWLPDRSGIARVGLLDFQLAQSGQPAYDLVSLLQDARRDVSPATEAQMIARFQPDADFSDSYAVWGAQRALRILGVFARLCLVADKVGYLPLLPRVWAQLQRNLAHPALAELREPCAALPAPTPKILDRIGAQCGAFR